MMHDVIAWCEPRLLDGKKSTTGSSKQTLGLEARRSNRSETATLGQQAMPRGIMKELPMGSLARYLSELLDFRSSGRHP